MKFQDLSHIFRLLLVIATVVNVDTYIRHLYKIIWFTLLRARTQQCVTLCACARCQKYFSWSSTWH